jgi:hypothetical protein
MNKQDIEKYLRMLGQELLQRQVTGETLLVGGEVIVQLPPAERLIAMSGRPGSAKGL